MFQNLFSRKTDKTSGHQPAPHLIDLQGVEKNYATAAGDFHALKGVELQVDRGEFVAVIGKSGSGKSTLSNMITGIDRPSRGTVTVNGAAVDRMSEGQIARWRGLSVGSSSSFSNCCPPSPSWNEPGRSCQAHPAHR